MNKFLSALRFKGLTREVKLIMLATFITNIGNGMFTIAVSKLVYDKTNSALAFGGVLILQHVVMFFVQFLSGSVVDRKNPKYISVICDTISGLLVLSSGAAILFTNIGIPYLFAAIIIINIVTPFFNSANFALLPGIVKDDSQLLQINGITSALFQAGQLLGCALVAPVIFFFNPSTALIIDGITFFISAAAILLLKYKQSDIKNDAAKNVGMKLISDWREIGRAMKKEKSFAAHLFIASGDYISINLFNLMLVPMVTNWYHNNSFYISLFDGSFAVGAMIFASFVVVLSRKIGINNSAFIGLFIQAVLFIVLIICRNPFITFIFMIIFGAANSFSVTIFTSNLQKRSIGAIKGRVSSLKSFIVSCITVILIPFISKLHDISISYGLAASFLIILTYSLISYILGRNFAFGKDYISKNVVID